MRVIALLFLYCFSNLSINAQSPERIFYSSMSPEGWDIYLAEQPGEPYKKITDHPALDYDAIIDPSGKYIMFTSERDGFPKLWIKNIKGNTPARLLIQSESMQNQVAIAPNGQWMVFVSTHEGNADIYKLPFLPEVTQDINNAINLTNQPEGDFRPAISPDGNHIVFSSTRGHEVQPHSFFSFAVHRIGNLYKMNADGSNVQRLTETAAWDGSPVYSDDGRSIYFYSGRTSDLRLYKMNPDGSGQTQLNKNGPETISPKFYEDKLISSSWEENNGLFRLAETDLENGETKLIYEDSIDMLNPFVHSSGMLVFHGAVKPIEQPSNKNGFSGELLTKHSPHHQLIDSMPVEVFGVRRAFAAPSHPHQPTLIIESYNNENPLDDIEPAAFGAAAILVILLILALSGIVLAVIHRKTIKFWRYLLFTLGGLLVLLTALGSFFYFFLVEGMPLSTVRTYLLLVSAVFVFLCILTYRIWQQRKRLQKPHYRVSKLMTYTLSIAILFTLFAAFFSHKFFNLVPNFHEVNYLTNDVNTLPVALETDVDLNPTTRQIIDMKYHPDGSGFQFTMGRFGSNPNQQGDIYEYLFDTQKTSRLTDSDQNDGFGGFSEDMNSFIFRSGRNGTMDIYLKTGNELKQLTQTEAKENFPAISLQGDKIIYCSDDGLTKRPNSVLTMDIFLMQKTAEGWSQPKRITNSETLEAHPHFSPDGEWIIYTTEEYGIMDEQPLVQQYIFAPQMYGEIVAQRLSDGKKVRITHNKWEDGAPLWENAIR
ncbi:DUF5050 domain-containing protein [Shivajiella indica]|uniref:DUF5050 domain-containing protein n=1 Tax=Shivajiella indica TaxID=872115 RepID=A0ABW5B7L6_9BACT